VRWEGRLLRQGSLILEDVVGACQVEIVGTIFILWNLDLASYKIYASWLLVGLLLLEKCVFAAFKPLFIAGTLLLDHV
jgi:hypothetical protein